MTRKEGCFIWRTKKSEVTQSTPKMSSVSSNEADSYAELSSIPQQTEKVNSGFQQVNPKKRDF
jgi:hypothetical protein